jgi:hypothetical protein
MSAATRQLRVAVAHQSTQLCRSTCNLCSSSFVELPRSSCLVRRWRNRLLGRGLRDNTMDSKRERCSPAITRGASWSPPVVRSSWRRFNGWLRSESQRRCSHWQPAVPPGHCTVRNDGLDFVPPSAREEELGLPASLSSSCRAVLFLPLRAMEMDGARGSSPEPAVALDDEGAYDSDD